MNKKALSPEYALLGLLDQKPAHGYELHRRLTSELDHVWHISLSQTYNILKRLETQGIIQGSLQPQENLPDRRFFHLTESGRARYEDWLHQTSSCSVRAIRIEFATRLFFAYARDPELADRLIETQIHELQAGLKRLESSDDRIGEQELFNRFGLELRLRQLNSVVEWLRECQQTLRRQALQRESIDEI